GPRRPTTARGLPARPALPAPHPARRGARSCGPARRCRPVVPRAHRAGAVVRLVVFLDAQRRALRRAVRSSGAILVPPAGDAAGDVAVDALTARTGALPGAALRTHRDAPAASTRLRVARVPLDDGVLLRVGLQ